MKYAFKKRSYILTMSIFDFLGRILFFPSRIFKKNPAKDPHNILVVRLDHIGDFVCTTPVFKNLKKRFPDSRITVLVNSASKELAYRDPNIDKVITLSPFWLSRSDRSYPLKGFMRIVKDVKNIGFDLGIEPRGDLLSIIIMWLGGVKYRVGYGITGGRFLLHKEGRYNRTVHIIDRNLALLRDIGIDIKDRVPEVHFNEKDTEVVEGLLRPATATMAGLAMTERQDGPRNDGFIVLHPFAGAKAKEWTHDNFQELIYRLKKTGHEILLVGSAADHGDFKDVIDLRGSLNLPQLACLIKRVGLFIGLDSGPANIAAALGTLSVIISSGTNRPELWIPNNPNVKFVYKDIKCRPCENKVCPKLDHECMESISVDGVYDKFKEIALAVKAASQ